MDLKRVPPHPRPRRGVEAAGSPSRDAKPAGLALVGKILGLPVPESAGSRPRRNRRPAGAMRRTMADLR